MARSSRSHTVLKHRVPEILGFEPFSLLLNIFSRSVCHSLRFRRSSEQFSGRLLKNRSIARGSYRIGLSLSPSKKQTLQLRVQTREMCTTLEEEGSQGFDTCCQGHDRSFYERPTPPPPFFFPFEKKRTNKASKCLTIVERDRFSVLLQL